MKARFLLVFVVMMLAPVVAWGDPFLFPPNENWPAEWAPNTWVTPFPFQRNIHYTWITGSSQEPIYEGTDDPVLKSSDCVTIDGLSYFAEDPVPGGGHGPAGVPTRIGLWGIDNRFGTSPVSGFLQFSLDNWDNANNFKHIWKEVYFRLSDQPEAMLDECVTLPGGYNVVKYKKVLEGVQMDNYTVEDVAWKVWPNPPHETITLILNVPVGGYAFIDDVHFATECVSFIPEPASVTLALLGSAGLLALRRRLGRRA